MAFNFDFGRLVAEDPFSSTDLPDIQRVQLAGFENSAVGVLVRMAA